MGKTIKDKVQLEQLIDQYLSNDVPLSLLTNTYDLTYPQMSLLINRTIGFSRQTEKVLDNIPEAWYGEVSDDVLLMPHEFPEGYPKKHEEQMELFKRLAEIKEELAGLDESKLAELKAKYEELGKKLGEYNPDLISKIEKVMEQLVGVTDSDDIAYILIRNGIAIKELSSLNAMYNNYLNDRKRYLECEKELNEFVKVMKDAKSRRYHLDLEYEEIREQLVVCNVKLANWCIRRFFNNIPLPKDETQLFAFEGLVKALNNFDYTRGFHFSTFAVPVITRHIERHFDELYGMKWEEFCAKESIKYYRKMLREEDPEATRDATPQELANLGLLGLSPKQIANIDEMIDSIVPMSSVYPEMESEYKLRRSNEMPTSFEDYEAIDSYLDKYEVPGSRGEDDDSFEEEVYNRASRKVIQEVLATLTEREQSVLAYRFGLNDGITHTLEETGIKHGVTRERVRQIEAKALRRLRHPARAKKLRGLLGDSYSTSTPVVKVDSQVAVFNKIVTLMGLGKSIGDILVFLKMDDDSWTMEKLVQYILYLKDACKIVNKKLNEEADISVYGLENLINVAHPRYMMPREVLKKIISDPVNLEENFTSFIALYITPMVLNDEEPRFGGK